VVQGLILEELQKALEVVQMLHQEQWLSVIAQKDSPQNNEEDLRNLQHYTVWTTKDKETNHGQSPNVVGVGVNMTHNNANFAMLSVSCATRKDT
jgi:hypothetical protein